MEKNNMIELVGKILTDFEFSHEFYGEKFYSFKIKVFRSSGNYDILNAIISERLIYNYNSLKGITVGIDGNIRTFNYHSDDKNKLLINVFVDMFDVLDDDTLHYNNVLLNGFICKNSETRETPLGRLICDSILAVNRQYGKSDYCPIISWGRNARLISSYDVGKNIKIEGRLQSRIYEKDNVEHTVYEISVTNIL